MAHISGYSGSLTFSGTASETVWAPAGGVAYPGGTSMQLMHWTVNSEQEFIRAFVKDQDWATTFPMVAGWRATMRFLIQDSIGSDRDLEIRNALSASKSVTVTFVLFGNATTGKRLTGSGHLTGYMINDPIDGPAEATIEMIGNGPLSGATS